MSSSMYYFRLLYKGGTYNTILGVPNRTRNGLKKFMKLKRLERILRRIWAEMISRQA